MLEMICVLKDILEHYARLVISKNNTGAKAGPTLKNSNVDFALK